jgi:hypothetical protein
VVATALGVDYQALIETTWIRPEIERGLEADQCYLFDRDKLMAIQQLLASKVNDVAAWPNPDLAAEVDLSEPQADRPAMYAALRVPEVWIFDGETVVPKQLGEDGKYVDVGQSQFLLVDAEEVRRWLVNEDSTSKRAWQARLRAWAAAELPERRQG